MTSQGEVADGRSRPDVVHGPDYRLAAIQDFPDTFQRQHSLIHPMQVDDICLLKLRQACNVCACIGYIDCEKIVLLKAVGFPDDNAFPHKPPYLPPVTLQTY